MYNRRSFFKLSAGMIAAAMLTQNGCRSVTNVEDTSALATPSRQVSHREDGLRVAIPGVPKQFDPAYYSVLEEYQIGFAIFDGLVWVDETLTPQPMLAEAWESSRNLEQWTFKLREDVTFHHGTGLTAHDVVHTFTRILEPSEGSSFRNTISFIDSVEALDDYTVRFLLKSPSAELPILLGAPQARIVAHDYDRETLAQSPSGTGPFQFVKNIPGERTHLIRNSAYWQEDRPQLASLDFVFMTYAEQINALQQGAIDMMMQVGMADVARLAEDPALSVAVVDGGAYQSIVLQATTKPFRDVRVREALKYCMDRQRFQREQLQQRGELGNDHPVARISTFHADLPLRSYDPEKARSLLIEAGYRDGLKLDLLTSTVRPGMEELAIAFMQMAKPAGIHINVIRTPPQVYWSDYAGRVPFHTGNWGFRPSIDETFMVAYHSMSKGNESRWQNPMLDTLVDQARGEALLEKRRALYHQAQQLVMEEGAVIIPYFLPSIMAKRADVQGFIAHPSGWMDLRTTRLG